MKWKNISNEKKLAYILHGHADIELSFDKNGSYYEGKCSIGDKDYTISRRGFWKTNVTVTDERNNVVAELMQEKWYSRKWRLQLDGHNYYIKYQNNPLFELLIEDYAAETIIKYRLITDNNETDVELEVLAKPENREHLDIMILVGWYTILPICIENTVGIAG